MQKAKMNKTEVYLLNRLKNNKDKLKEIKKSKE
jgi:hypothetical protein